MVLVDTSVWADHLRSGCRELSRLLERSLVMTHPFIVGELALGNLANRDRVLQYLRNLPATRVASGNEVLHLVENQHLMGRGIGWVDAHLLASALLSSPLRLFSRDTRLRQLAAELGVGAWKEPPPP